eukprot:c13679_g1_i1 orf=2-448(-)
MFYHLLIFFCLPGTEVEVMLLSFCNRLLHVKGAPHTHTRHCMLLRSNIVPYSCYELASMLLQQDSSSTEGLKLLEQCVTYAPHEFQGRLKFVAGELFRQYGGSPVCDSSSMADAQNSGASFRRVSRQILKGLGRRESHKASSSPSPSPS